MDKLITDIRNACNIELTLIKKKNESSKSKNKEYIVRTIILDSSAINIIKEKAIEYLDSQDKKLKFSPYGFTNINSDENGFTIKAQEIPNFNKLVQLINKVILKENDDDIIKMKDIERFNPNVFSIKFSTYDYNNKNEKVLYETIIFNNQIAANDIHKKHLLLWENEKFICTQKALSLKNDVDCVYSSRNGLLYILNKTNFERIFDFKLYIRKKAEECLESIKKEHALTNYDLFKKNCLSDDKITYNIALIAIRKEIIPYKNCLSEIKSIIKEDNINLEFNKENQIIFDENSDKKQIKEILKILSDDKLSSRITKRNYEQGSFLSSIPEFLVKFKKK